MKTKELIKFNPLTSQFTINNEEIAIHLAKLSIDFNFRKYKLYHLAYRLYQKWPWLYDMADGVDMLGMHILGLAMEKADEAYKLNVKQMVSRVVNISFIPDRMDKLVGFPIEGQMMLINSVKQLWGYGLLNYDSEHQVETLNRSFHKLYYLCWNPDKSTKDIWNDWLTLSVEVIHNLCKDYEGNKQLIDNLMDRAFSPENNSESNQ